jgi:hypothetical protein
MNPRRFSPVGLENLFSMEPMPPMSKTWSSMARQKGPIGNEGQVLAYLLKAGNYRAASVGVYSSEIAGDLRLDIPELVRVLRNLSSSGFIRLISLPRELETIYVSQVFDDLDMLDLRYVENKGTESGYVSTRQSITDQLKLFPHHAEPFSPLEAARLFHELNRKLERILSEFSQLSQPHEVLEDELLAIRSKLLPFRRLVFSRIREFASKKRDRSDLSNEARMRMLILFSQVGMSRLATAKDAAQDLLEELDVLRARHLLGEISQSELEEKEKTLWNDLSKRTPSQLPNHDALAAWAQHLTTKLEDLESLRQRGGISKGFFQTISEDLHEDIALLKSHDFRTS